MSGGCGASATPAPATTGCGHSTQFTALSSHLRISAWPRAYASAPISSKMRSYARGVGRRWSAARLLTHSAAQHLKGRTATTTRGTSCCWQCTSPTLVLHPKPRRSLPLILHYAQLISSLRPPSLAAWRRSMLELHLRTRRGPVTTASRPCGDGSAARTRSTSTKCGPSASRMCRSCCPATGAGTRIRPSQFRFAMNPY